MSTEKADDIAVALFGELFMADQLARNRDSAALELFDPSPEPDPKALEDRALAAEAAQKELEALLNGEADGNDTFLEINAGAGGTESCDWASMLARMYVRWAEKKGYKVELQSETGGDEAGIRSEASYLVLRTKRDSMNEILSTGRTIDLDFTDHYPAV